jgi:hypothetical protein
MIPSDQFVCSDMLKVIFAFLSQWFENIDFLWYNRGSGFDLVTFPLTHDPHRSWMLLPKSRKARKVMLRTKCIMKPQECYAFLRTHQELSGISLGSTPSPRTREEAIVAMGDKEGNYFWNKEFGNGS